jgi:hypothetical protein
MRITLLGVLGLLALAALLVYIGQEFHGKSKKNEQLPPNPILPVNP